MGTERFLGLYRSSLLLVLAAPSASFWPRQGRALSLSLCLHVVLSFFLSHLWPLQAQSKHQLLQVRKCRDFLSWVLLLTLQLQTDTPDFGSGLGVSCSLSFHLALSPGTQQLALLAQKVHRSRAAITAFAQGGPCCSLRRVGERCCFQLG